MQVVDINPLANTIILYYAHHLYLNDEEITELTIPEEVNNVNSFSFCGCKGLKSVITHKNVLNIEYRAFHECSNLMVVYLGSGIQTIANFAFSNCAELTDVYSYAKGVPNTSSDAFDGSYTEYATLHVLETLISDYQTIEPWNNFKNIVKIEIPKYSLIYLVDGKEYKKYEFEEGVAITPDPAPRKEGYTFSGWSEIPETMPAHDVIVTGTFTINKYKLTYIVDGEEYKSYELDYGANITPKTAPTKEGYTFSGWSDLPETMPAKDVTVTGTFTVNKYKLTYSVDGEEYKSYDIEYGSTITSETEPTKEGYTFSGWSDLPETMPANDVTVTGTFTINKYKVTYMIDGEVYQTVEVEYGSTITPPNPGDREGYDFAWGDYPSTMPAEDITINGSYTATDIRAILADESDVKIYTVNGKPLNNLQRGVNILRYKDGRTQKLIIK